MLELDTDGRFEIFESYSKETCELVNDLNKLLNIDGKTESEATLENGIDDEIKTLVERVKPFIDTLDGDALGNIDSESVKSFLQSISLVLANFIVNDFIKTEIDTRMIDKMTNIYIAILDLLRSCQHDKYSFLLSRTSFISPLLITISFSLKLNTGESSKLIKILAVLFTYLVKNQSLFESVVKMFTIDPTTNIEMFQVFNKLWEKTLETPQGNQFSVRQGPGPISIINRMDTLNNFVTSPLLIDHVFPYTPSQYISQLCQSSLKTHAILSNIKNGKNISAGLLEFVTFVANDIDSEVLLLLIESTGLNDVLLKLYDNGNYQTQLGYIFSKISQISYIDNDNSISSKFLNMVLTKDINKPLESSIQKRYQVLFEVIDHSHDINFLQDFGMSLSLEKALFFINRDFELMKDHLLLANLGSSLNLPALFIHITFVLCKALLKFTNDNKSIPKFLEESLSFKKMPPLPKSEFLDFDSNSISPSQLNLKNFQRVTNSLNMCLSILNKIILNYSNVESWIHPMKKLEAIDDTLEYQSADKFLQINFSAYFAVLMVSNEFLQKSKNYGDDYYSAIFYDLSSIGHVLKLQTFLIFDKLLHLYDSFAFFKLVKFIMKISMLDLDLQKSSIKILDHLIFHTNNGMKEASENNELIRKLLQQYILLWSDGTEIYKRFENILGLKSNTVELVNFDTNAHLKFLGITPPESNISPTTSSSTSSSNNYNYTNQSSNYGLQSTLSTPNNSFLTNNNINQPISQDNSYFGNPNNILMKNQIGLISKSNTPLSAGTMDQYNTYRSSNIKNVQSFIPQHLSGPPSSRAPSVHVDQLSQWDIN